MPLPRLVQVLPSVDPIVAAGTLLFALCWVTHHSEPRVSPPLVFWVPNSVDTPPLRFDSNP